MAKDKKNVTNAMRLLNASKIKYETVEYEADEVGEHSKNFWDLRGISEAEYRLSE